MVPRIWVQQNSFVISVSPSNHSFFTLCLASSSAPSWSSGTGVFSSHPFRNNSWSHPPNLKFRCSAGILFREDQVTAITAGNMKTHRNNSSWWVFLFQIHIYLNISVHSTSTPSLKNQTSTCGLTLNFSLSSLSLNLFFAAASEGQGGSQSEQHGYTLSGVMKIDTDTE